jgi:hypothetical protein
MIGLLPSLLILVPAIGILFLQPQVSQNPSPQGQSLFWAHAIELRIAGLRVTYYPQLWKTVLLIVGMSLYVIALVSMFFGPSVAATNP